SALRFPSGVGPDLLAQLVAAKSIELAHLDGALDFSWARDSREGSGAFVVLLRSRRVCSVPRTGTLEPSWPSSLRGSSYNDGDLRRLGDSLLAGDGERRPGAELVGPVDRPSDWRGFQTRELAAQYPTRSRLLPAVDAVAAVGCENKVDDEFRT